MGAAGVQACSGSSGLLVRGFGGKQQGTVLKRKWQSQSDQGAAGQGAVGQAAVPELCDVVQALLLDLLLT